MHNGFAIALAWPQTLCKQAGAWYDFPLYYLGINRMGYYKVGHAALVLIDDESGICHYFDFGRYHAPPGHGRVRSKGTDYDLKIRTRAIVSSDSTDIFNLKEILTELYENRSTHGTGAIFSALTRINHIEAEKFIFQLQDKEDIPYGPFIQNGTNCSRFVNSAILAGNPPFLQRIKLQLAPMLTPTPMWNLKAVGGNILSVESSYNGKAQKNLTPTLQIMSAS